MSSFRNAVTPEMALPVVRAASDVARVLVVEDDDTDAAFVGQTLGACGSTEFVVTIVATIADALEALTLGTFDVVLLDLGLPDSTGLESFVRMASDSTSTPIVILSGASDRRLERQCVQAGAQECLPKSWLVDATAVAPDTLEWIIHAAIDRHALHERLREQEQGVRRLLRYLPEGLVVVDGEGLVRFANEEALRVLGSTAEEILGCAWSLPLQPGGAVEVPMESATGSKRLIKMQFSEETWEGGPAVMVAVHDVTVERRRERELGEEIVRDQATGLPNRVLVMDRLNQALESAPEGSVGVVLVEMTGHSDPAELDWTMRDIAARFRNATYPRDLVGRVGDTLLAVVAEGIDQRSDLARLAQRLSQVASQVVPTPNGDRYAPQVRTGTAVNVGIRRAEHLLRSARGGLRPACSVDGISGDGNEVEQRFRLWSPGAGEIRDALEEGQFVLHYQPIYALDFSRKLVGFEALVRWMHPTRGELLPDVFLEAVEREQLTTMFGNWTARTAIAQAAIWRTGSGPGSRVPIYLNVTVRQLVTSGFEEVLLGELSAYGLGSEALVLEVNESSLLRHPARCLETLASLRDSGFSVLLDDFGTGYSALAHLSEFPISGIKINGGLISRLPDDRRSYEIIEALVTLCRALSLEVVAEHVETEGQLNALLSIGCGRAQGHLFSRPLSPDFFDTERSQPLMSSPVDQVAVSVGLIGR